MENKVQDQLSSTDAEVILERSPIIFRNSTMKPTILLA
jgi:hypothetical protein